MSSLATTLQQVPRSVVVGTAGHIDHGKTSLVRALTGVDADRLPEEKRRGITIDLGFAELDLGDVSVSFVDVPGHERFVKNMLAGAGAIDAVLLVIAADEGVMPQTREHFDICRLLGVRRGIVVLTKQDAVEREMLALARAEAEELIAESFLDSAPVIPVSARTGEGLEKLKVALREMALSLPARASDTVTRLPVDRAFSMRGFGAVVTGTLVAGEIAEEDEMELLPTRARVRVRGVQVHNRPVARSFAGQRTAVNLGGVSAGEIERGHVLVAPAGRLRPTQVFDARIEILANAPRPLRSRARVRVHAGTAEVLARVSVLEDAEEIATGASGFVQLRLESPIVLIPGERFIVRSYSPQATIGGGRVLNIDATKYRGGRERTAARNHLSMLDEADSEATRLALFVEAQGERGMSRADAAARTGWRDEVLDERANAAARDGRILEIEDVFISRRSFDALLSASVEAVSHFHRREPLARGLARAALRERVFASTPPEIFRAVLAHAEQSGALVTDAEIVRARAHSLELSAADAELRARLEEIYNAAGLEIQTFDEALARASQSGGTAIKGIKREQARKLLQLLIDGGQLARIEGETFVHSSALARLIKDVREYAARRAPERTIDVAAFKELAGISRKYAIPLLEYLDRAHVTRRAGDCRLIL